MVPSDLWNKHFLPVLSINPLKCSLRVRGFRVDSIIYSELSAWEMTETGCESQWSDSHSTCVLPGTHTLCWVCQGHACVCSAASFVSDSSWPHRLQPARLLRTWASLGENTAVGCHALLQQIFPTQGSKPCLLYLLLANRFFTTSATWEVHQVHHVPNKCNSFLCHHLDVVPWGCLPSWKGAAPLGAVYS